MDLLGKKRSRTAAVSTGIGNIFGNAAAGITTIPTSIMAGTARGIQEGREATKAVRKEEAVLRLIKLPNVVASHQQASNVSELIKKNKNAKKNLALSGLSSNEYQNEIERMAKEEAAAKKDFEQVNGIQYDEFARLTSYFESEQDFIQTAGKLYEQASEEVANDRKRLEKNYKEKEEELTEAYNKANKDIRDREQSLENLASKFMTSEPSNTQEG